MRSAQRLRELLDSGAVDVFDATAFAANGVMVMVDGLAEHERRFAVGIRAFGNLTFCAQPVERAIDGRKRYAGFGALEPRKDLRRR